MSGLEPTRTYSNPTATDVLRRLLDERGVEHEDKPNFIKWDDAGQYQCFAFETFERQGLLRVHCNLTPAQAIAATLDSCNCSNNCTNGKRTETCEADETDTWECVRDDLGGYGKTLTVHVMECTECGHVYEHVNGDYEYCPRCGRKRRDVDE